MVLKKNDVSIIATAAQATSMASRGATNDGCSRRGDLLAEEQAGLLGQCTTSEPTGKAGLTSLEVVRGALAPPALKTCASQGTSEYGHGMGWDEMGYGKVYVATSTTNQSWSEYSAHQRPRSHHSSADESSEVEI